MHLKIKKEIYIYIYILAYHSGQDKANVCGEMEGRVDVLPKGRTLSSESVSLSVLSSTRKSGQFQDILTIPSDSCNSTWASIRP